MASSIGQVLHLVAPHGQLPGALFGADVRGYPSSFSDDGRRYAVVIEMPSVTVPKCEGWVDVVWWSVQRMGGEDGMLPPMVYEQS